MLQVKELNGLTGLRFLAAFYVFIFHIHLRTPFTFLPAPMATIISMGAIGVNLFFVLSGFILTYAHLKDFPEPALPTPSYYGTFLLKRVARIYPAYLIGLAATLGVSIFLQDFPSPFPLIVALDATMLQSYFPSLAMLWYGGGAWSVSTEFFFYLLFPFLLPLLLRLPGKALLPLLVLAVVASSLPGLFYATHPGVLSVQATYAFPPCRLPEFVCGVLLGLLIIRRDFRVPEWSVLLLLLGTALYLAKFGFRLPGYTGHNFIVVPAIMAVIALTIQYERTRFFRWVGSGIMQYLGRISYSFYIMQLPLMILLEGLMRQGLIHKQDTWVALPILVLNLLLAAGVYEAVEKPAHRFLLTRLLKKYQPSLSQPYSDNIPTIS